MTFDFLYGLAIHSLFAFLILFLGLTIGEWYVNNMLNVSSANMADTRIVYHITISTTCISTFLVPYNGLMIACEKFRYTALVDVLTNLFKLAAVLTILFHVPNRLICYSVIMSLTTLLHGLAIVLYSLRNYKGFCKLCISRDKSLYREMLGYSGWTALGSFTNVGKAQLVAIIINFFFGTVVNAAFAVANQINNFIVMFANSLNTAAVPQITKSLNGGDSDRSFLLSARISKYTFFLMLIASFPVLMEIDFLLSLWLKEVPNGANVFSVLIVVAALFLCVCQGTGSLVNATGKIKWFQIISNIYTLASLSIGWLCFYLGSNEYALSIVLCVFMFFNIPLNMYLLKRVLDFDLKKFSFLSYLPMIKVFIPLTILFVFYKPQSFSLTGHIIGLIGSFIGVLLIIFLLGLDNKEKKLLFEKTQNLLHKH